MVLAAGATAWQRRCLRHGGSGAHKANALYQHEGGGTNKGKGGVSATNAVEFTRRKRCISTKAAEQTRAKAVSQPRMPWSSQGEGAVSARRRRNKQGQMRCLSHECRGVHKAKALSQSQGHWITHDERRSALPALELCLAGAAQPDVVLVREIQLVHLINAAPKSTHSTGCFV